ncbi:embryo-specific protein ATS3A-like [Actinidia eriantha]|uniref:embryo-specific protein ATS3A-like n=1 Tax=Actinidia eriantha TaxID=165200 RepID=UPI002583A56A|nr:embryo-specific protein ATS3A-like [Actinidia eriantha]
MMIDCRGSILLLCVFLAFGFIIAGSENLRPNPKGNCTYALTIETTCTKGADSSNHVSLRFGDTNSNDILVKRLNSKHLRWVDPLQPQVLDDVPRKPFQACMVDQFQITGQCVESPICYLYLKLTGDDDWRPGFAQVQVLEGSHLSSNYFYFRRYLPRHVWHGSDLCDREVTPFGIKHKRKIFVKKTARGSWLPEE